MKILFDIVHPAHIHFFRNPISILKSQGHEIHILSRNKDITTSLLEQMGWKHTILSKSGSGIFSLMKELLTRDFRMLRYVTKHKPDVMIGFGGVSISHIGALTGIPSLSFYDTETATLQTAITYPFITELHVPTSYTGKVPARKTQRFKGYKAISYLHPNYFTPSKEIAIANGLDPEQENFFIRLVSWNANHDLGKEGWSSDILAQVISTLSQRGKVHISSERELPAHLVKYEYIGNTAEVAHLLGHCRLYIGESATMASEAAVLGVPAIISAPLSWGYIKELEEKYRLVRHLREFDGDLLINEIDKIYALPESHWNILRDNMLLDVDDVSGYIVDKIMAYDDSNKSDA